MTIRVSRNAIKAHMRHGDSMGPCSTATFAVCHKAHTKKVKGAKNTAKHLRHGDKLGKCKKAKKAKAGQKGKSGEKGKSGQKGKPVDTPGNGPPATPAPARARTRARSSNARVLGTRASAYLTRAPASPARVSSLALRVCGISESAELA